VNLVTLKRVPAMRKQAQTSEISDGQLSEISYKGVPLRHTACDKHLISRRKRQPTRRSSWDFC
jgi:hypothetical protein